MSAMKVFFALTGLLALTVLFASTPVGAAGGVSDVCSSGGSAASTTAICQNQGENIGDRKFISALTNTLLFILGIAAVVVIVIGGLRYTTANGDPQKVSSAKNTIMYAVVGLVVAVMAWAIVTFVVNSVTSGTAGGS